MQQFFKVNNAAPVPELLIYGYIGAEYDGGVTANDFVTALKALEQNNTAINVRINSPGGSVFEGLAIYNAIKCSASVINTYIDGIAASMGSVIALAGKRVYISSVARMMTHQASGAVFGKSGEMKAYAELMDSLNKTINSIYAEKTGMDEAACTAKFLGTSDKWFTAKEAIECKLADEIYSSQINVSGITLNDINALWGCFNNQLKITEIMAQTNMSAAALLALNIQTTATMQEVEAAITAMAALAASVPQLKTDLTAAQNKVIELTNAQTDAQVTALVDGAIAANKLLPGDKERYVKLAKADFATVKELIDSIKPSQTLETALAAPEASNNIELQGLIALSGRDLYLQGKFERLKQLSIPHYSLKHKEYFGFAPKE